MPLKTLKYPSSITKSRSEIILNQQNNEALIAKCNFDHRLSMPNVRNFLILFE